MSGQAELAIRISASDAASAVMKQVGGSASGLGSALAGLAGGVVGGALMQLPGILTDAAKAAAEDAASVTKLATAVENSGASWGAYSEKLNAVIDAGIKKGFSDSSQRDALALLTAQTGSADEAMRRMALAQDLSRGTGMSLEAASRLLGKATDENVNVLARYGIKVQEGASATELFGAVQEKFGGQADAFANSTAGMWESFNLQMGELQESLGQIALPLFTMLGGVLTETVLPAIQDNVVPAFETLGVFIYGMTEILADLGSSFEQTGNVIGLFADVLGIDVSPFEGAIQAVLDTIYLFSESTSILGDAISQVFSGDLPAAGQSLLDFGRFVGGNLLEMVGQWAEAFLGWIAPMLPGLGTQLAGIAQTVLQFILDSTVTIVENLATWAGAFVDWIAPQIPGLIREAGAYMAAMVGWMAEALATQVLPKLAEWGQALVAWVAPRIPPLLAELGTLLLELGGWVIGTALPAILGKLAEWGAAFVSWVGPQIVKLLLELGKLEVDLLKWIAFTALPNIVTKLGEWAKAFVDWVADAVKNLPGELAKVLNAISSWAAQSLNSVAASVVSLGAGILQGIQDGVSSALGGFFSWLKTNFVDAIPDFIKKLLDIRSPSGVFFGIGQNLVEGLRLGMQAGLPSVDKLIADTIGKLGGSGDVGGWLAAAMQITGAPPNWLRGLLELVSRESGTPGQLGTGDPSQVNPTKVGNENATGLIQMLPSTFRRYALEGMRDIFNPVHNAVASIRYIKATYGSVNDIPGLFNGEFRGYATGGIVPGPIGAPQLAMVHGGEEITPPGRRGGGFTWNGNIIIQGYNSNPSDLARQVRDELVRIGRRNGNIFGGL